MSARNVFEHPLNERMRAFLRLSELFTRAQHFLMGASQHDAQCALLTLLELSELTSRVDLKRELMKELERQSANLTRLTRTPGIDTEKLVGVLEQQKSLVQRLHGLNGPIGAAVKNNELLAAVAQRSKIPGGLCEFDLPVLHHWLRQPIEDRRDMLLGWLAPFAVVQEGITVILDLIRKSASETPKLAEGGFYQQALDASHPFQLIRVSLPLDTTVFPEVSAGKQRFTIRFLELNLDDGRTGQIAEDIAFDLACCAL
ncbi:MAG: cell division protein ZapD [Pseudomonadota bacterium]